MRSGADSAFQFILKALSGVEILHSSLNKPCAHGHRDNETNLESLVPVKGICNASACKDNFVPPNLLLQFVEGQILADKESSIFRKELFFTFYSEWICNISDLNGVKCICYYK